MPLLVDTATTTTATMESDSNWYNVLPQTSDQTNDIDEAETINSSQPSVDDDFEESQCLFCNHLSSDMDQNLVHMSKGHGLHVVTTNLLVDVASLLAYFHLVISCYHECLYCGTQRNTIQAAQQHMIAKRHCKYDLTFKDTEFREFYDFSSSEAEEELRRNVIATRLSDNAQLTTHNKSRRSRPSRRPDWQDYTIAAVPPDRGTKSTSPSSEPQSDTDTSSDDTERHSELPIGLSTRSRKHNYSVNNQLAQLRADDRRSLMHLPVSQQRALLATHHKQREKATRSEQIQRGNLESAGNSFARLGTIRLIRKPPHTGRVQTLKR